MKSKSSTRTTLIIKKVCDELGIKSRFIDDFNLILELDLNNKSHIFVANNTGLNDEVVRKICNDKYFSYLLLDDANHLVRFPKTYSFVDPNADDIYQGYNTLNSNQKVVEKILDNHQKFPIIVKANSLSRGLNVYKCLDQKQVTRAVHNIFNKKSKNYDHVLISQDYINIVEEYRVVVYNQEVMFVYKKDIRGDSKFVGNLSPLHWENSKAVLVKDKKTIDELRNFIMPIYSKLKLNYGGLDIGLDKNNKLFLIEINTQPGFSYFIRDNSAEEIVKLFKKILQDLKQK